MGSHIVLISFPGVLFLEIESIIRYCACLHGSPTLSLQRLMSCVCCLQYHTKIDAIVDQAQYPGSSVEGAWFCTL